MILTIKCKYSGQAKDYSVSDSLCELKGITSDSPLVGETDSAYIFEVEWIKWRHTKDNPSDTDVTEYKRAYLNKSHCKKVTV